MKNFEDKSSNTEFIEPFDPKYKQYEKLYFDNIKYLPLSLSQEDFLYPLENNKVFNLNSQIDKDFASKYQLVTIDPDIASILGSYGFVQELDIDHIFYHVKQECESGTVLEKDSLLLLYKVMVEKKNQLIDNIEIKSLIESLPIFIDNKGNICSLKGEQEEVFLQGLFVDYTGTARILDNEIIDSVEDFKKSILIDHFKIKALSFTSFVENYFEMIFNELNIDTDIKLKLIEDFSKSTPKSEKVQKTLQNTKFIYCNDKKFHSSEEKDIFNLNTTNKETFALKHNLLIMDANVKTIVSQYQFLNELDLDRIIDYVCIDIEKGSILTDSDIVLLYKLIFDERKCLSNEELKSKIRKLPIFKNSRGDFCALENNGKEMVLLGNYKDPIGVNEILRNAI